MARAFPQNPGMIPIGPQSAYAPPIQPPPGGFATHSTDPNQQLALGRTVQTFSSLPVGSAVQTSVGSFSSSIGIKQYDCGVNGCEWMIVSIQASEVVRVTGVPTQPLSNSEIINAVLGTGAPIGLANANGRYSILRARVSWNDGSALQRSIDVDIAGGISLQMFARNVSVEILLPEDSYMLVSGNSPGPNLTGSLYDSLVSARCAPVNALGAYLLSRSPQLTEFEVTNGTSTGRIPIPSGASEVDISVGDTAAASTIASYTFQATDQFNAYRVTSGDAFLNGVAIPSWADTLTLTSGAAGPQRFSAIFKISP
jgi:hypothetical protein